MFAKIVKEQHKKFCNDDDDLMLSWEEEDEEMKEKVPEPQSN